MDKYNVSASDEATIGSTGSPVVSRDFNIDQSKYKNVTNNYVSPIQHNGEIGSFNFDLRSLQSEEVNASRVTELNEIRSKLGQVTKTGTKVAILRGIGGSGKTTLAKLYADDERSIEPFVNLVWIDAEDSAKVVDNFWQILNIITPGGIQIIGRNLADDVYNSILKHKTLIVFDNVENAEDISDFLPTRAKPPYPQFIITTRNELKMPGYRNHWVHVYVLSWDSSEEYIRKTLEKSPITIPDIKEKWSELATYFGRLVFALRAATSSIVQQNEKQQFWDQDERQVYTIKMYLCEIKQVDILHVNDADSNDPAEITYKPLRQIWTKTLDDLASRPQNLTVQLAERILEVLAFLSPTGVPERWFRTLLQSFLDSNEMTLTTEMNADARRLLASMSLVEISNGKLVIHRLLQTTLLSRLNGAPHLKFGSLNWLLPAIVKLYSILRGENRLQNFDSDMDHLFINISTDLLTNVPNLAVSFLVQLSQPGMESCKKLLKKLIRGVFEERVLVSRDSSNLLVTSAQVVDSVLLLPLWFRECSENVSIEEQLALMNKILNSENHRWRTEYPFDVYASANFCQTIAQVLAKWKPQVQNLNRNLTVAGTAREVISSIHRLCETLSEAIKTKQIHSDSRYRHLNPMLKKLYKGLVTALSVVFSQQATTRQNLEAMFKSVGVAIRWYLTVDDVESCVQTIRLKTLKQKLKQEALHELDNLLAYTGLDRSMVQFYAGQLHWYYNICDSDSSTAIDRQEQIQLEARMAASFVAILEKCSSVRQQNGINRSTSTVAELHLQKAVFVPFEVIPLMEAIVNWEQFRISTNNSILKVHLFFKGLETHLEMLKTNVQKPNCVQFVIGIRSFINALGKIVGHVNENDNVNATFHFLKRKVSVESQENWTIKYFRFLNRNLTAKSKQNWTIKKYFDFLTRNVTAEFQQYFTTMFPNFLECSNVTGNILERYIKPIESSPESLSFLVVRCEDRSDEDQLVETFEEIYERIRKRSDRFQLHEILQKTCMVIQDPTNTACRCLVSRCQRMLAGFLLEEGNNEDAIAVASAAFEHQLYCADESMDLHLVKTIQVMLDACTKSKDYEARSILFDRLLTESCAGRNILFGGQWEKLFRTRDYDCFWLDNFLCCMLYPMLLSCYYHDM